MLVILYNSPAFAFQSSLKQRATAMHMHVYAYTHSWELLLAACASYQNAAALCPVYKVYVVAVQHLDAVQCRATNSSQC